MDHLELATGTKPDPWSGLHGASRGQRAPRKTLPSEREVHRRVTSALQHLVTSKPGRRAAAASALWIAATSTDEGPELGNPHVSLQVYRLMRADLRADLRAATLRAAEDEPDAGVRHVLRRMLLRFAVLEALATAPKLTHRR